MALKTPFYMPSIRAFSVACENPGDPAVGPAVRYRLGMFGHLRSILIAVAAAAALGCPLPPEEQCQNDLDCDEGKCVQNPESEQDDKVCAAACGPDDPCTDSEACINVASGGGACFEVDGNRPVNDACSLDTQCESGACEGDVGNRRCVEVCGSDGECSDGDTRCTLVPPRRVCLAPLDNKTTGEACDTPRQCASGYCINAPHVAESSFCADGCGNGESDCEGDNVCAELETGAHVCVPAAADGEPCIAAGICAGGRCVNDDGDNICASNCDDWSCATGFACLPAGDAPVCVPTTDDRAPGEDCDTHRDCSSGHCEHFATDSVDWGKICADTCIAEECGAETVCWEVDPGPSLCGPIP